jgi:hypothetical protein
MDKMIAFLLTAALAACQAGKSNFCAIAEPVRLSADAIAKLSDAEVKALLSHNSKGMRLCGWKP